MRLRTRGSVSIEKVLDGGAAAAVPEDQEFTVTASFIAVRTITDKLNELAKPVPR